MMGRVGGRALEAYLMAPVGLLPPSTRVDFLHLVALGKPCIRFPHLGLANALSVARWSSAYGFACLHDDTYTFVARSERVASRAQDLDNSKEKHERAFGLCLGYPECCCDMLAVVGEANLDRFALEAASWNYSADFRLISPEGYLDGSALICHVPCSPSCRPSRALALSALAFIREGRHLSAFAGWSTWEDVYPAG